MLSGTCHRAKALFNDSTALELNRLYRSRLIAPRTCASRTTLATRRSTELMRSPYMVPGATMLTVVLAAPPDNGRPSDGCTKALLAVKLAAMSGPGRLWKV